MKSLHLVIASVLCLTAQAARWPGRPVRNPMPWEVYEMLYPQILIIQETEAEEIEDAPYMQRIPLRPNEVMPQPEWSLA